MYEIIEALDEIYKFLDYDPTIEGWKFERTKNAIKVLLSKSTLVDLSKCLDLMVEDIAKSDLAPKICDSFREHYKCEYVDGHNDHFSPPPPYCDEMSGYSEWCILTYYENKIKQDKAKEYHKNNKMVEDFIDR